MLTPQEVSERAFAKASFGGYNMAMVDEFLDILTADYSALYNDNAVLKSKMKVLVDKVEEYRSTEEAMRKALMTAQRMADQLVKEAEEKKASILQDAEREAADRIAQIRQEVKNEEYRLTAAREATAAYVEQIRQLHRKELEYLDGLSELAPAPAPDQGSLVEETAQDIEQSVQRILEAQMNALRQEQEDMENTTEFSVESGVDRPREEWLEEEETNETDEDEGSMDETIVHRDFGRLEFGRDYEIK